MTVARRNGERSISPSDHRYEVLRQVVRDRATTAGGARSARGRTRLETRPCVRSSDDLDSWRVATASGGHRPRRRHRRLRAARPGRGDGRASDGEVVGSVSGGCVEGAVVTEALSVLAGDRATRHRDVRLQRRRGVRGRPHVRRHDPAVHRGTRLVTTVLYDDARATHLRAEQPVALATVIDGPGVGAKLLVAPTAIRSASLGHAELDRVVAPRRAGRARGRPLGRAPLRPGGSDDARGPRSTRRSSACSSRAGRRRRRCGSSAPSTSPPPWPRSPRCSATGWSCATPARSSPPAAGSRWPTRSACRGPGRCSRSAARTLGRATRCASSPTTRSSTCRPCRARSPPRSATSA